MGFPAVFDREVFHIVNRVIHREIKKYPRQTVCLQGESVDNRRFSTVIHNLTLIYITTDKMIIKAGQLSIGNGQL